MNTTKSKKSLFAFVAGLVLALPSMASARDFYYVNDHLATTLAVIDDVEGEIAQLEADAFGSPINHGGNFANPTRYTGKPYDEDLGAYVFPYRNYRSEEGRWISADPSGFPNGLNGNRYAPIATLQIDPLGLLILVNDDGSGSGQAALNIIKADPVGSEIYNRLHAATETYVIYASEAVGDTNSFSGRLSENTNAGGWIDWNPTLGVADLNGNSISPITRLFHEMAHADGWRADYNAYISRMNQTEGAGGFFDMEGYRVMTEYEHPFARRRGEGNRTTKHGSSFKYNKDQGGGNRE